MPPKTHSTYACQNVVCFPFSIGQRVRIKAIDQTGIVYTCALSRDGMEFSVKWWDDQARCVDWFQSTELEAAPSE